MRTEAKGRQRPPTMAETSIAKWLAEAGDGVQAGVLLPGWQGRLVPADPSLADATTFPASLEPLLRPLLGRAVSELKLRVPPSMLRCGGQPILLKPHVATLRLRLIGVASLPLALACEGLPDPVADNASITRLIQSEWKACLSRFPLMESLLIVAMRGWIRSTEAFLRRLHRDGPRLAEWLELESLPPIRGISSAGADMHDGGDTVLRVAFATGHRLYYKPRPVTGEFLWHALLTELAGRTQGFSLPCARVLPGSPPKSAPLQPAQGDLPVSLSNGYGWMEPLPALGGAAEDLYWRRAGSLLCVAQHFALTDLHMENVVAGRAGPAVADAECLGSAGLGDAGDPDALDALREVLATGLLPGLPPSPWGEPLCHGDERCEVAGDVSGLFGHAAAVPWLLLPCWKSAPGRLPQLALTSARLPARRETAKQKTLPQMSPIAALPYLREGYRSAAHALLASRRELLADGGWLDTLERVHAPRVLIRTTLHYALVLSRSLFPEYLQSGVDRRAAVHGLLDQSPHLLNAGPLPTELVEAEAAALLDLDLPRFVLLPGTSRELAPGRIPLPQVGTTAPVNTIRRRLEALSEERLATICLPALSLACMVARR